MNLTAEQQSELTKFPAALRDLVEAELAAGNSIVEVGHSHPAPLVGAYFKLAKKVTTRARASGDGLRFFERNSSLYSGEFTDASRFFFVLEPGNPPPPYPDMDAIRRAHEPKPAPLTPIAPIPQKRSQAVTRNKIAQENRAAPKAEPTIEPTDTPILTETDTSATRLLHFRDRRPPHEVQFVFERELMTLLQPSVEDSRLTFRASSKSNGVAYRVRLQLEAALLLTNCYLLEFEAAETELSSVRPTGRSKALDGWVDLWTRDFKSKPAPEPGEGSVERAQKLTDRALAAEAHLTTIPAIQQAILTAMRAGATYSTAHKEGGTNIRYQSDCFVRADYGESDSREVFRDEAAFLKFLRQFYDWETSRNTYPQKVSDFEAWKLILRLLRDKR